MRLLQRMTVGLVVSVGWPLAWGATAGRGLSLDDLFSDGHPILQIRIEISNTNLISLETSPRTYVAVTIREGETAYTNVALRLKGNEGGSFRPVHDKPAMTVNFDKFEKGQLFHGCDKLYLNNSVEDPTYMNEFLCGELFRSAGIPAPRIGYATVELNGSSRGLYVVKEGFNKRFLERSLGNSNGNFYDGGWVTDIDDGLRRSSGKGPDNNEDLKALAAAAREVDPDRRWERLGRHLDRDQFISFMAMEVLVGHWDGYTMNRNNYRVYNDPGRGILFMPHGMDIMFSEPDSPPAPYMDGLVSRALIETRAGSRRYRARLGELRKQVFKVEAITNRVNYLRSRIRPSLAGMSLAMAHDEAVSALLEKIAVRGRTVNNWVLEWEPRLLRFNGNGLAKLTGWRVRDESTDALLTRPKEGLLSIEATPNDEGRPSWRRSVFLAPGSYRFVGRVRTEGVKARATRRGDGAGIRAAGMVAKRAGISGHSDWRLLSYAFKVEPGVEMEEVELICELLASEGRAWFDLSSLSLLRMKGEI